MWNLLQHNCELDHWWFTK